MKIKISIAACLAFLACLLLIALDFQKESAFSRKVREIPPEDHATLAAFFHILMFEEGGAYVLFGDKPVAFTACFNSCEIDVCSERMWRYYSENQKIINGWKTWKKYRHLFPSDHFILDCKLFDGRRSEICLINKRKFKQMVSDNLTQFHSALGKQITSTNLLDKYLSGNVALFNLLKQHHALLGMLLGFGTENARKFNEYMARIGEDPHAIRDVPLKIPTPSSDFSDRRPLKGAFRENNHRKCYKFLWLPYFLADPNSRETQILRSKYLRQRQEIHSKYAHENFLEVTLKGLCLDL